MLSPRHQSANYGRHNREVCGREGSLYESRVSRGGGEGGTGRFGRWRGPCHQNHNDDEYGMELYGRAAIAAMAREVGAATVIRACLPEAFDHHLKICKGGEVEMAC